MKASKPHSLLDRLPKSGYKSPWLSYPMLLFVTIVTILVLHPTNGYVKFVTDTASYLNASETLKTGTLHISRTPIYPWTISLCKYLSGEYWPLSIVVIQFALFILSGFFLSNLATRFIDNNKIVFWLTTIYLVNPFLIEYGYMLWTDLPAMSLTVISLSKLLGQDIFSFRWKSSIVTAILSLILIFLRPFFVIIIPLYFLYFIGNFIIYKKQYRSQFIYGLASISLVSMVVLAYQIEVTKLYGIHSLTYISTHNNYFLTRWGMLPNPALTSNEKMKAVLKKYKDQGKLYNTTPELWSEEYAVSKAATPKDMEDYVNRTMALRKWEIPKLIMVRWGIFVGESYIFPWNLFGEWDEAPILPMINITFNQFLLLYALCALLGILSWYRQKVVPRVFIFLWIFTGSVIFTAVAGAQMEWGRLTMPAIPAWLVMFGMIANKYSLNRNVLS